MAVMTVSAVWEVVDDIKSDDHHWSWIKNFVIGSTVNPGYSDTVQDRLEGRGIDVFYNPEFIAQGTIICVRQTWFCWDQILCGGDDPRGFGEIQMIYEDIQDSDVHFYPMSRKAAEITKIGVNCYP